MTEAVTKRGRALSIGDALSCAGLTVCLCIGNAALLWALFSDGGALALAYGLTTGLLAGGIHGVVLGSRGPARRLPLYLAASLSWTIVVSVWLCLVAALTSVSVPWSAMLTLLGLGVAAFGPVAVGIEASRAWMVRRWAASHGHDAEARATRSEESAAL